MAKLQTYLEELEKDFTVDAAKLQHITNHFISELDKGKIESKHIENAR